MSELTIYKTADTRAVLKSIRPDQTRPDQLSVTGGNNTFASQKNGQFTLEENIKYLYIRHRKLNLVVFCFFVINPHRSKPYSSNTNIKHATKITTNLPPVNWIFDAMTEIYLCIF